MVCFMYRADAAHVLWEYFLRHLCVYVFLCLNASSSTLNNVSDKEMPRLDGGKYSMSVEYLSDS